MKDIGRFDGTESKWLQKSFCVTSASSKQFEWFYFSGILVVMAIMVLVGVVLFLSENLYVYLGIHNKCYTRDTRSNSEKDGNSTDRQYSSAFRTMPVDNHNR